MTDVVSTGEAVIFWILGPVTLFGALGMVFVRNAVHSALFLVLTMLSLGALYMVQQAPFLGFVQIIVYTGAVMMLFLFVLMLVGRDSSDSVVEVLRGQRLTGLLLGVALAVLLVAAVGRTLVNVQSVGLAGGGLGAGGNVSGLGALVFTKYLFAFELTSALLITAALGAMVLAYSQSRAHDSAPPSRPACAGSTTASPRCPGPACSPPATRWPSRRSSPTVRSLPSPSRRSSTPRRSRRSTRRWPL